MSRGNIWFISDTHFCHDKEFCWKDRGYDSVDEMNKDYIDKWNSVVDEDDYIYHLGDLMLGDQDEGLRCLAQLKGTIKVIIGNHDTKNKVRKYLSLDNIESAAYADLIKINHYRFYLSHYPCMMGDASDQKRLWNLSGHIHTTDKFLNADHKVYNVCVDAHNGFPVFFGRVIKDIEERKSICL